jgi:hypothetical protein
MASSKLVKGGIIHVKGSPSTVKAISRFIVLAKPNF